MTAGSVGSVVNLAREIRCVDHLQAGRHIQAAGAADHQQIRHRRRFGRFYNRRRAAAIVRADIRIAPARIKSTDHCIEALQLFGEPIRQYIGGHCFYVFVLPNFIGIAGKRRYLVAAAGQFFHHCAADITCCTDYCEFHDVSFLNSK